MIILGIGFILLTIYANIFYYEFRVQKKSPEKDISEAYVNLQFMRKKLGRKIS